MNRRNLLRMLAGAVVAPSGLLVPERKFFLPPAGGWPVTPFDPKTAAERIFSAEAMGAYMHSVQVRPVKLDGEDWYYMVVPPRNWRELA